MLRESENNLPRPVMSLSSLGRLDLFNSLFYVLISAADHKEAVERARQYPYFINTALARSRLTDGL